MRKPSRLKSVDAGHNSIQNLLSSCMLSKSIMVRYIKLMFCPAVLIGVKHEGKNADCVCKQDPEGTV